MMQCYLLYASLAQGLNNNVFIWFKLHEKRLDLHRPQCHRQLGIAGIKGNAVLERLAVSIDFCLDFAIRQVVSLPLEFLRIHFLDGLISSQRHCSRALDLKPSLCKNIDQVDGSWLGQLWMLANGVHVREGPMPGHR